MRIISTPLVCLRDSDAHELLRLLGEEDIIDARVPRLYYDAFQVAIANGDQARARVFAQRAHAARVWAWCMTETISWARWSSRARHLPSPQLAGKAIAVTLLLSHSSRAFSASLHQSGHTISPSLARNDERSC